MLPVLRMLAEWALSWSGLLSAIGLTSLWLLGRQQVRAGAVIGLVDQVVWVVYALLTCQPPFILSALVYAASYWQMLSRTKVLDN